MSPAGLAFLITLPLSLPAQTAIHEGSHIALPFLMGADVSIRFLPGRGRFGEATIGGNTPARMDLLNLLMPRIIDIVEIAAIACVRDRVSSPVGRGVLTGMQVAAGIDFTYNSLQLYWGGSNTDAVRVARLSGLPGPLVGGLTGAATVGIAAYVLNSAIEGLN